MSTEQTINSIFNHLSSLHRSIASRRKSGVDEQVVVEKLSSRGLYCHKDFLEVYRLCNGTSTHKGDVLDQIQFFPGYYWMDFEEALTTYDALASSENWSKAWFPVFASGGGDFYCVICDKDSRDFGAIVGFILGESDHLVEFKSMKTFLETIDRSFLEGAFFAKDGFLEADYSKMRVISRGLQLDFVPHDA